MIFVGVDWAEAHHDVHVKVRTANGWLAGGCLKEWRASPGSMRWSAPTPRSPERL